jgi:uncharacterized membrane protein
MSTLDKTIRIRTNVVHIIGWTVVCVVLLVFMRSGDGTMPNILRPTSFFFLLCGAITGLVCGLFQSEAIRRSPDALVAADSLMSVRRALALSWWGKASIGVFWVSCLGFLLLSLAVTAKNDTPLDHIRVVMLVLISYSAFSVTRDAVALPAVIELNQAARKASPAE